MKGQIGDRFNERFCETLSKMLDERFGESLCDKTKYAPRVLQSVAASES